VVDLEATQAIVSALTPRGIPVIVDEVYHGLYHDRSQPSAATLDGDVIVIGSASKALSLSGLRLGWLIDADDRRRERLFDIRAYFSISNTAVGEVLGAFALPRADAVIGRTRDNVFRNLARLEVFLADSAEFISCVRPRGSTVAFPCLKSGMDARPFCSACADAGVLLVPGDCFGWPSHFRLGYGKDPDSFSEGLTRVSDVLARVLC
jgi:aspartate/methionine/tyrosine aminotransferase